MESLKSINLNNDGTQPDNERKSWARILDNYEENEDDLSYIPRYKLIKWLNIEDRYGVKIPDEDIEKIGQKFEFRKAVSIIGGIHDQDSQSPSILAGLRSDLHENPQEERKVVWDNINHFENQFANTLKKFNFEDNIASIEPDLAFFIIENLEELVLRLLSTTTGSIDLHNLMLNRIFGIDVSEFKQYEYSDWGSCVNQEFGTSSYSLNDFSTKIENGKFKLKGNESMLRYKTIYHMAKALSQTISTWVPDNLGKKDRSIYKDETTPLWLEISNAIDSCETIQEVNEFFSENSDLSYWISEQLKSTSYMVSFHNQQ